MNANTELMSNVVHYLKYAKYVEETKGRESWIENVNRTKEMHQRKYPQLAEEINSVFNQFVMHKQVLASMRSMQFSGLPIELNESRGYNCSFLHMDSWKSFREVMFLLIGGVGVGYSVQYRHVSKLPSIRKPVGSKKYLIADDMIGWANAIEVLTKAYFDGGMLPRFDFRQIRKKGAPLKTSGGKAPGPEPLKRCLDKIQALLDSKDNGQKLTPIEVHDINCFIADAVLSGGIREAAMIALFSIEDHEMARCKSNFKVKILEEQQLSENSYQVVIETNGWMAPKSHNLYLDKDQFNAAKTKGTLPWYLFEPQRGRSNNSAIFINGVHTELDFRRIWKMSEESGAGEPAIIFTNDPELGTNPCAEIALHSMQMCNLTEINASSCKTQEELESRVRAAAFIGTVQAGYTDFHYLRNGWKEITEREALLGVSMTGIASLDLSKFDFKRAAEVAIEENRRVAKLMGIKPAARVTCVKPAGTTSLIMCTSSGIHAWFAKWYIRRLRVTKTAPLYAYLMGVVPALMEDSVLDPANTAYLCIPIKAPDGALVAEQETALQFLERVKKVTLDWIKPGHVEGKNTHNVSATCYVRPNEWDQVGNWMWEHRDIFHGLAVLPFDGGTYVQAPHETITEEKFFEMSAHVKEIDLSKVVEQEDQTARQAELACAGGLCAMPV